MKELLPAPELPRKTTLNTRWGLTSVLWDSAARAAAVSLNSGSGAVHSPLPGHLLLRLQQAELSQRRLQLLPAALHLLLQLDVEAAQLLVLLLDVRLFAAQLPDSGFQLRTKTGLIH
ncbi:hypothetical protein EYF80_002741 [Liparis tanakae]|uniref:Uncharacterized protein n=1 Tax=Liparis tanakae TaxID=230148 RepID=A0A4Z2J9T5_9TELE|nr:hypothetical protein EYF80_002741 [Liparis tanakae]